MYYYLGRKIGVLLIVLNRDSLIQGIGYTGYQREPEEQIEDNYHSETKREGSSVQSSEAASTPWLEPVSILVNPLTCSCSYCWIHYSVTSDTAGITKKSLPLPKLLDLESPYFYCLKSNSFLIIFFRCLLSEDFTRKLVRRTRIYKLLTSFNTKQSIEEWE